VKGLLRAVVPFAALALALAQSPKYSGPPPAKADLPYLKHANNLIESEAVEVKEGKDKDDTLYTIAGENSKARTPLPLPVFVLKAEKIDPLKLRVYQLQAEAGHRQAKASAMKSADVIHMTVTRLAQGLFQMDVGDMLEKGEYMMRLEGTNQAFCFAID
jgi:hypothetical protein